MYAPHNLANTSNFVLVASLYASLGFFFFEPDVFPQIRLQVSSSTFVIASGTTVISQLSYDNRDFSLAEEVTPELWWNEGMWWRVAFEGYHHNPLFYRKLSVRTLGLTNYASKLASTSPLNNVHIFWFFRFPTSSQQLTKTVCTPVSKGSEKLLGRAFLSPYAYVMNCCWSSTYLLETYELGTHDTPNLVYFFATSSFL